MARNLLNNDTFDVKETELVLSIPADETAIYTLRAITLEHAREVFKAKTKKVPDPRTRQMVDELDQTAAQTQLLDDCLVKWIGVREPGATTDTPCTIDNKLRLPVAVQTALIERAQIGQVTPEAKAASFPRSA